MAKGLEQRQREFNAALDLYLGRAMYRHLNTVVAAAVIVLQLLLLARSFAAPLGWRWGLAAFLAAYLFTDFLNGLIHLVMDHQAAYTSPAGPLIAAFHLHHRTPRYQQRPLWAVYFHESGFKIWLPFYLLGALALSLLPGIPEPLFRTLAWTGLLSSVAEVSHYLSHNSNSGTARNLARIGLLLDKRRHARHHREDNVSYAFLNGWTNPLLDWIARRFTPGYKTGTDLHFAAYRPDPGRTPSTDPDPTLQELENELSKGAS